MNDGDRQLLREAADQVDAAMTRVIGLARSNEGRLPGWSGESQPWSKPLTADEVATLDDIQLG